MNNEPQSILIVQIASLGETVLALPALRSLRRSLPHTRITMAVSPSVAEMITLSGGVDEVLCVGRLRRGEAFRPGSFYRSIQSLRSASRLPFDLAVDFSSGTESALLLNFARPLHRLPSERTGLQKLVGIVTEKLTGKIGQRHLAQRYLEMLAPLGVRPQEAAPRLGTDRTADERIDKRLRKKGVSAGELLIGLHPGAASAEKRWPVERFATLAASFIYNYRARVIIFAGPRERRLARLVAAELPRDRMILFDTLPMNDFVSALARLSVFIGNHSGPAHLASATGVPVVVASATSGPSSVDLLGRNTTHVRGLMLQAIPTDDVYQAACLHLQTSRAERLMAM